MKKTKLIATLAMGGILLSTGALNAAAADNEITTNGSVQFDTQDETSTGIVTKPETEGEIIEPETGAQTKGPLRLTHVPDFDFGKVNIASEDVLANAILEEYKNVGQTDLHDISHFIQIEDVRGIKSGWKVSVSSSKFLPSDAANKPLANTHIVLQQGKLFNTRMAAAEIASTVEGFTAGTPITSDGSQIDLLKTVATKNTDSSKTSLVFNDAYTGTATDAGSIVKDSKATNPGVQLKAVGTDEKAKDETYTATLTWSIVDAK